MVETESDAVSVRIYRNSKPGQHAFQADHDMRTGKVPAYVDRDRIHDNSIIIPTISEDDARALCQEKRAKRETKRAMKKGTTVTVAGIITFGREAQKIIRSLDHQTQDAAYLEIAKACAEYLKTTLVGVSAHRDEYAPHAHFTILAYNDDGFPLSETVKKMHTSKLQDIAANVLQKQFGLDIKRGKFLGQRIADGDDWSKTHHRSVKQLQQDIPREIADLQEKRDTEQRKLELIYDNQEAADGLLKEKLNKIAEADDVLKKKLDKIAEADNVIKMKFEKISEVDGVLNEKIEKIRYYKKLADKAKAQAELENANAEKAKKRAATYEKRIDTLIADIATLENADSKEVREALESTGVVSKREVIFAGSENEEPEPIFQVNHDNDLDWD